MNPFDANERHRYIIESGGNPVSSADGKEKEIWVNSINIDIDTPIYRYMKWEYLQQFYSEPMHEWILVRPCLWQDKFEQFIFKCDRVHSIKSDMDIEISNLADQYYAQCWTIIEESSLQWQVNKQHTNSCYDNINDDDNGEIWVKVRSTPRKLLGAMFYSSNNLVENTFNIMTYFIGKVEYLDSEAIEKFTMVITVYLSILRIILIVFLRFLSTSGLSFGLTLGLAAFLFRQSGRFGIGFRDDAIILLGRGRRNKRLFHLNIIIEGCFCYGFGRGFFLRLGSGG